MPVGHAGAFSPGCPLYGKKLMKLKDPCITNPFDFVFFRYSQAHLSYEDKDTLSAALKDVAERFKAKNQKAVRILSERYINIHGSIPAWSLKFFEGLAKRIKEHDLRNYLIALTTKNKKSTADELMQGIE
jgi:hypothetical protein